MPSFHFDAPPPPDSTLAANYFTALAPNYGVIDKFAHLSDSTLGAAWRGVKWLFGARNTTQFDGLRPPGQVAAPEQPDLQQVGGDNNAPQPQHLQAAVTPTLRSRETWKDLPQLPVSDIADAKRYNCAAMLASDPAAGNNEQNGVLRTMREISPHVADAFFESTDEDISRDILPPTVLNSTLINASAQNFKEELARFGQEPPQPGQKSVDLMTHLSDPKTGFSAGITYDRDRREVIIGFSGIGSSKMGWRQGVRCAMNWLGFIPKNVSQASKLTRLVKAHIDQLNETLPDGQKIKLTLAGHSMGGGLASYAALRNKVPAVVTNPMRLGWGCRARIGQSRLVEADKYLTEVVVQGDWVSDNNAAKLYQVSKLAVVPAAFNMRGPLGNARRFMVPNYDVEDPHNNVCSVLRTMEAQDAHLHDEAPTLLPFLQRTSPRAQGDMAAGNVEQAVQEAVREERNQNTNPPVRVFVHQSRNIARLVQMLLARKSGSRILDHRELDQARADLRAQLDEVQTNNPGRNLPTVNAIRRDFVTNQHVRLDGDEAANVSKNQKLNKLL